MLDWVSNSLGIAANFPWRSPFLGLVLSIVSALITFFIGDSPVSWVLLGVSMTFAVWAFIENSYNDVAGFAAGLAGSLILISLAAALNIFVKMPHGCIAVHGKSAAECIRTFEDSAERSY